MDLTIRPACRHDAETLFRWRNHPDTYRWFHTPRPVEWDEHVQWLTNLQWDRFTALMIISDGPTAVATVRFDLDTPPDDSAATVSVTVAPERRGAGYGTAAIRLATAKAFDHLDVSIVFAHIYPDNTASIRAFIAAGYKDEGRSTAEEVILVARIRSEA